MSKHHHFKETTCNIHRNIPSRVPMLQAIPDSAERDNVQELKPRSGADDSLRDGASGCKSFQGRFDRPVP